MQLSLRRLPWRALHSRHMPKITTLPSILYPSSQQRRSYLWIVTPDDDDSFYGKYLEDSLESNDEQDLQLQQQQQEEQQVDKKNKKGDLKVKKSKGGAAAAAAAAAKNLKFNLKDYQQMEASEESYDYDEEYFNDSLEATGSGGGGTSGGLGDLEEYLQDDDVELLPGAEYASAYDPQEVDLAIDMHGADEARNMRTVPSPSPPSPLGPLTGPCCCHRNT